MPGCTQKPPRADLHRCSRFTPGRKGRRGPLRIRMTPRRRVMKIFRVALALLPGALLLQGDAPLPDLGLPTVRKQFLAVVTAVEEQLDKLPAPPFVRRPLRDEKTLRVESPVRVVSVASEQASVPPEEVLLLATQNAGDLGIDPPDQAGLVAAASGFSPPSGESSLVKSDALPEVEAEPVPIKIEPASDEVVSYLRAYAQPAESDSAEWPESNTSTTGAGRGGNDQRSAPRAVPSSHAATSSRAYQPPGRRRRSRSDRAETPPARPWSGTDFLDRGFEEANALLAKIPGLIIEKITFSQGYSSNAIPRLRGVPLEASQLGSDLDSGASATFGWRHFGPRNSVLFSYEPSMIRRSKFSEWNTTNHNLKLDIQGKLSPRWEMRFSGRGASQGLEQFFLDPPVLRRIQNPPATLDDLADAVAGGKFTDDEIAAILTGSPVVDRPAQVDLDVRRVLTAGARTSATYARSRRLSIEIGADVLRSKTISGGREEDSVSNRGFISSATSARAKAGFSYELSPDSKLGLEVAQRRTESSLRQADYTTAVASYEKEFGRGWSTGIQAGAGGVKGGTLPSLAHGGDGLPGGLTTTWIVGGRLGYNGRSHKFSVSTVKNVGDNLGLGSQNSLSTEAEYHWARPGAPWALFAGGNVYQADVLGGLTTIESKLVRTGIIRRVGDHGAVITEYTYGSVVTPFTGVLPSLSRHRVQVSFIWKPSGER